MPGEETSQKSVKGKLLIYSANTAAKGVKNYGQI
ncbi:uncharacterized protein METZ01_LOCUS380009, partial [marine metagenome]